MKKKIKVIILIAICLLVSLITVKTYQKKKAQEKYAEIKENVKNAVEWNISAVYPFCSLIKESNKNQDIDSSYHSSYLIQGGYIKRNELLDIDNKSYCDVFVEIYEDLQNPSDYQNNCEISYKIYLKCKNYEDEGYIK